MRKIKILLNQFLLISLIFFTSCNFISSFSNDPDKNITISFDKNKINLSMGAMDVINLKASSEQNLADIHWLYDDKIISAKTDNYSAVITGLSTGTTTLTAICGSNSASCVINVTNNTYVVKVTNPYVYASADYVNVTPSDTIKISASLFGGTVADNNGFVWSIDKPSVASISTEGNYCWISGVTDGFAKLTVKHNKAAYPYSVLVNCSSNGTSPSYITTPDNIITINLSEDKNASFSVDLVNPPYQSYAAGFQYKIVDALGNEMASKPVVISASGGLDVSLSAYEEGECYVRCTHPNAMYSLDVLVRVIKNAETAYIEPSKTLVTVTDKEYEEVTLSLANFSEHVEPSDFKWSFSESADEFIEYHILNGNASDRGDKIRIKGIKTGSVKATVSYKTLPTRNIIILVRDVKTEAADALSYITTSQNFIKLSMDDDPCQINVVLTNSNGKDINDLHWKITNMALDSSKSKVINYKSGTGKSSSVSAARNTISSSTSGYCVIEPVSPGTAYIDISHPKALYPTRITVVVAEKKAKAKEPTYLNLVSSPVVALKNGESFDLKVSITGDGKAEDVVWEKEGNVTLSANALSCNVQSPPVGSGGSKSIVKAKHPDSDSTVTFSIVCYDTKEEYDNFAVKAIYSNVTNAKLKTEQNFSFSLLTSGFTETPRIAWTVKEGEKCIDFVTEDGNKTAVVTAKKKGKAVLVASCDGCDDVSFYIEIEDVRIVNKTDSCYLSTSSNILYFEDILESHDITVDLFNIDPSSYSELQWKLSDNSYEISANNNKATVTALSKDTSATLTISHPLAENVLVVNLKTGKQFEYVNKDCPYISTNKDVFNLFAGQDEVSLIATLNHTEQNDSSSIVKGFKFAVEDESVATIAYVNYSNTCYIKPIKNGKTKIIVTHPDATFEKEVIVIVDNVANATKIPYITTSTNVITVVQGNYVTASVQLMNSTTINNSAWHWETGNNRIADVIANNGTSALISANAPGTVELKVKHDECAYSLKLLVVVLDAKVITDKPYIQTDTNIITLKKGSGATLTAQMIGGNSKSDSDYFRFTASNSSMILLNAASASCYIKALNTGIAYITIYNSRYSTGYSKTVLVVIEDTHVDNVYIKPSQTILKLKPESSDVTMVSAELVNGLPTDAENFIWWADDYNLVNITAVAGQCSIAPTGRNGTTKVHIKHSKAAKQADILVMVSDYDSFAFGVNSANINTDKLYFFPLQVPSIAEDFEVKYSSSNENVCIVNGSNSVAWVCGLSYGNASLTASMVAKDGTVIATAELLVSVSVTNPVLPVVSLGDTILTVDAGTSRTISATLTGENINPTEKFNLKWSVKDRKKGITLLDENTDKVAYGSDVYVTFDYGGEYVLSCEHTASGVSTDLYIKVLEKGEVEIELSSTLETIYKDDGSFTLTAKLINGTEADYKTIEWSALKIGGQSIVSVSKTKGATCTVSPKAVGQTTVYAKLPNGKTASCIVIVRANAEIKLDLGAIHVIPGYTEVVNYKTVPENAAINWYTIMSSGNSGFGSIENYFSFEDDTAKRQLRITGIKAYNNGVAGTISAAMVGASAASSPTLKVYVNYEVELRLEDNAGNNLTVIENNNPDTNNTKTFKVVYYPTDLDIDIKVNDNIIACIPADGNAPMHQVVKDADKNVSVGQASKELFYDEGVTKCRMTVSLIPHAETDCNISVIGTLPADKTGTNSKSQSFYYTAFYKNYDIEVVNLTSAGAFTEFSSDQRGNVTGLTLADGEDAAFSFRIKNENASGKIIGCSYSTNSTDRNYIIDDYWSNNKNQTRQKIATKVFEVTENQELSLIETQNRQPQKGLLYYYEDTNVLNNSKVYHLCHNWDYYKDLPKAVEGDKWNSYKKENNYSNNFLTNLDVDYWLVDKELMLDDTYYALPHNPPVPTISASWNDGVNKERIGRFLHWDYYYYGWTNLKFNNKEVFYTENLGLDLDQSKKNVWLKNISYKNCIPYVITKNELVNNKALVRPDRYLAQGYQNSKGWFAWEDNFGVKADNKFYLEKLIADGITPTIRKGTKGDGQRISGSGKLYINYTTANNKTASYEIVITVKKFPCESYTNNNWKAQMVNGNQRWTLDSKLFDSTALYKQTPYFSCDKTIFKTITEKAKLHPHLLDVNYEVCPADAKVSVTIPKDAASNLKVKNYSSQITVDGNVSYYLTPDLVNNGRGKGTIQFENSGYVYSNVKIEAQGGALNSSENLSFYIKNDDYFVPAIQSDFAFQSTDKSSGHFSYVDIDSNMIVIGDGEELEGSFYLPSGRPIKGVYRFDFEYFTPSSTPARAYNKDSSGRLQSDLVKCSLKKEEKENEPNTYILRFNIRHKIDYGYFIRNKNGYLETNDEFYGKKFPPAIFFDKQLHEQKKRYAAENQGKPMTSYTMPYYYENGSMHEEPKTYPVTPIGRIIIGTNGNNEQEIFVCVKVTEDPCAKTNTYGLPIPSPW